MGAFDSVDLMKSINDNLGPFRKAQSETMLGFRYRMRRCSAALMKDRPAKSR